jgi:hypothetical protein
MVCKNCKRETHQTFSEFVNGVLVDYCYYCGGDVTHAIPESKAEGLKIDGVPASIRRKLKSNQEAVALKKDGMVRLIEHKSYRGVPVKGMHPYEIYARRKRALQNRRNRAS